MFNWKSGNILITGASSGLGRSIAIEAGKRGATVILIARNKDRLAEVKRLIIEKGATAFVYSFDLNNVEEIPRLHEQIQRKIGGNVTVLINNVGYQAAGFVINTPVEVYEKNYRVNTIAPVVLIQCVLPDMLKNRHGTIANVMSSIMYHSFPGVSSYSASKKALGAIHESLKAELTGTPIKTLYIRPGSFKSNYWKNTKVDSRIRDFKYPSGDNLRDPSYVATRVCNAIENGEEEFNLSTLKDKIGYHLCYWAPRFLDKVIVQKNQHLLEKMPIS